MRDPITGQENLQYAPRSISYNDLKSDQSILSQIVDPFSFPALSLIGNTFYGIALYAENNLGRFTPRSTKRRFTPTNAFRRCKQPSSSFERPRNRPGAMRRIVEQLKLFYGRVEKISTRIVGGTVQVYLQERDLQDPIPATRLSDGTIRLLCLLVILCHPTPPPLVCIEEPELGLHPDIIPTIAELLVNASQRTQLIVTTHSEMPGFCTQRCSRSHSGLRTR